METHYHIFTYAKLIGYPLLGITLIVFACDGCRRFRSPICRVHIALSVLLSMLWISAMINLITGEGSGGAHNFNTYVITPILIGCIIYIWCVIMQVSKKCKKRDLENQVLDCPE